MIILQINTNYLVFLEVTRLCTPGLYGNDSEEKSNARLWQIVYNVEAGEEERFNNRLKRTEREKKWTQKVEIEDGGGGGGKDWKSSDQEQ